MEHDTTPIPLDSALTSSWSKWLVWDPRIEIRPTADGFTLLRAGLSEVRIGLNINEVNYLLEPLMHGYISKDEMLAKADKRFGSTGLAVVQQMQSAGIITESMYAPHSLLYARISRKRMGNGVAEITEFPWQDKELKYSFEKSSSSQWRHSSCREYNSEDISLKSLGDILYNAYGQCREDGTAVRPVPSAGGVYGLRILVKIAKQNECLWYDPYRLGLVKSKIELSDLACTSILNADWAEGLSAVIFMYADMNSWAAKYGERAFRFALLEAGHVGQRIIESVEKEDCRSICIGSVDEDMLALLSPNLEPIYTIGIGKSNNV